MATAPTSGVRLPQATDWVAASKIACIEAAFLASVIDLLFLNPTPAIASQALTIAVATGTTLGVLWVTNTVANAVNVRSFLQSPTAQASGVVPIASGTQLVTAPPPATPYPTEGAGNASNTPTH